MSKPIPSRWQSSDTAIKAVQVAFDVEETVMNAVRRAAFDNSLSASDQIRLVLGLSVATKPKRPRLTVSLSEEDYRILGKRYGIDPDERLKIKEHVTQDLIQFAQTTEDK
ncbi:hypothetical protein [Chitinivorax sp. B]|uniref:hypothetical protein n=1 Tax=Chitinivorax sp. B TaxID=2502235 RepID=UPI0010F8E2B4|nr:hypothetical protein [Chitinivorax sp. B]